MDEVEGRINFVLGELETTIVELVADSYQSANRKLALPTVMERAREYVTKRKKAGATALDLVSGKQALSRLSEVCKGDFGVSFSPMSICRQMAAQDIPLEVKQFLGRLI